MRVHPSGTRRAFLLSVLLAGAALLSGCGGDDSDDMSTSFDRQFIDMMVPHHQSAMEMAEIAQQRGEHAEIRTLAGEIIREQGEEIAQMKAWRRQWFGSDETPPMDDMPMLPGMDHSEMRDTTQTLAMLQTAQPFDRAFIDEMIMHHQTAIEAAQIALQKGERAEIRTLAGQIITAQQREIEQMRAWRAQWYPGG